MRCLKIKTQDDNCEQATKNFSLQHSKPIYFDFKLNLHQKTTKSNVHPNARYKQQEFLAYDWYSKIWKQSRL